MAIISDLIDQSNFRYDINGGTLVRRFLVSGLIPAPDIHVQAMVALAGIGVSYGSAVPNVIGLFASNFQTRSKRDDTQSVYVDVTYTSPTIGWSGGTTVKISGATSEKSQSSDGSGNPLLVTYSLAPAVNVFGVNIAALNLTQVVKTTQLIPHAVLEFSRIDPSAPDPTKIEGFVNSTPWQGKGARTWMCRDLDSASLGAVNSIANVSAYKSVYKFEFDPDGWDTYQYFTLQDGTIPPNVQPLPAGQGGDSGMGVYTTLRPSADFNALNFPQIFT